MTFMPRRSFVAITGAALVLPNSLLGSQRQQSDVPPLVDQVPPMLDHILLGSNDLQLGVAFVEQHTGVRAAYGGVHPGRGTQNALLSLGTRRYLEIIAPDPQQTSSSSELPAKLKKLTEPRLVGWAAHPGNLQVLAADLARAGVAAEGPTARGAARAAREGAGPTARGAARAVREPTWHTGAGPSGRARRGAQAGRRAGREAPGA